jgi:hypothetical protein
MADEHLFVVRLASLSGLSVDQVINSFAVDFAAAPDATALGAVAGELVNFYNENHGAGYVAQYLSGELSRAAFASRIDIYDISASLAGTPHGSPIQTVTWTLAAGLVAARLPAEVAVALSIVADQVLDVPEEGEVDPDIPTAASAIAVGAPATHAGVTRPRARRRGRLYVGPLNVSALDETFPAGDTAINPPFANLVATAAQSLVSRLPLIDPEAHWCVWSRRDAQLYALTDTEDQLVGWIDDAFDTQRRRGRKATSRTLIPHL